MRLLRLTLLFVLCAFAVSAQQPTGLQMPRIGPGVSHDLDVWRVAYYSDVRYKLNLTLEKMSPVLKGTIEIRVNVGTRTTGSTHGTRTPSSASPQSGERPPIILDWRKIAGHDGIKATRELKNDPELGRYPDSRDHFAQSRISSRSPRRRLLKMLLTNPPLSKKWKSCWLVY